MTPDQYRREGAEAMREAAIKRVEGSYINTDEPWPLLFADQAIRAIDVDEVLAGLPTAPDAVARLVEAARALVSIVEGIDGAMNHGTWRDERGMRLKDTPEWVGLYNALAAMEASHE